MSCIIQIRTRIFKDKNEKPVTKRWERYGWTYLKESLFGGQDFPAVSETAAFDKIIGVHRFSQKLRDLILLSELASLIVSAQQAHIAGLTSII